MDGQVINTWATGQTDEHGGGIIIIIKKTVTYINTHKDRLSNRQARVHTETHTTDTNKQTVHACALKQAVCVYGVCG